MKKLIIMLIMLPILLMAVANQAVDSTIWTNLWIYPIKAHWIEYIESYECISLFRELDIAASGTTMIWEPVFTGPYNCFSLDIPAKAESLEIEYFPGIQLTDITDYPYRWQQLDTIPTGTDSTYRKPIFEDPLFFYGWLRFINLTIAPKVDIPIYMSGKEQ